MVLTGPGWCRVVAVIGWDSEYLCRIGPCVDFEPA